MNSPNSSGCVAPTMSGMASTLAKKRAKAAGFGTNAQAVPYLSQSFAGLRAQSLSAGTLFCDPAFPAAPESLGFKELGRSSSKVRGVTWKRPSVRPPGGPGRRGRGAGWMEGGGVVGVAPVGKHSAAPPTAAGPRSSWASSLSVLARGPSTESRCRCQRSGRLDR